MDGKARDTEAGRVRLGAWRRGEGSGRRWVDWCLGLMTGRRLSDDEADEARRMTGSEAPKHQGSSTRLFLKPFGGGLPSLAPRQTIRRLTCVVRWAMSKSDVEIVGSGGGYDSLGCTLYVQRHGEIS